MERQFIIAHADKTILKISGIKVKGLDIRQLEHQLMTKLDTFVRVIGVTGDNIEMDIYNVSPEQIRYNDNLLIDALSLTEGISATDLLIISCSDKIVEISADDFPKYPHCDCAKERWLGLK